jgi:hypothetical protein
MIAIFAKLFFANIAKVSWKVARRRDDRVFFDAGPPECHRNIRKTLFAIIAKVLVGRWAGQEPRNGPNGCQVFAIFATFFEGLPAG